MRIVAAVAGAALAALAWLWWRARSDAARLAARLETASGELERLQRAFALFVPESLVDRIAVGELSAEAEKKEVTVLFADLVGYTPLAERLEARALVDLLNGWFTRMGRTIAEHRGHVTTFMGDGILALFGAFEPNPWQGDDAVHAALAMRRALEAYNGELEARGLPRLALGIGLHRGLGVAGVVGGAERREFSILGHTVNVASRVQSFTRQVGGDILVTEDLQRTLDPRFILRALPPAELKGVAKPVVLFEVDGYQE